VAPLLEKYSKLPDAKHKQGFKKMSDTQVAKVYGEVTMVPWLLL